MDIIMKAGNLTIKWRYAEPMTACFILNEKGAYVGSSNVVCSPRDHFCKDTGRKKSLSKVLINIGMPKEERRVLWELYRNMSPKKRW